MVHILVAVDRSAESRNATLNAFDIVGTVGGRVTALHVTDVDDPDRRAEGETALAKFAEAGAKRDIEVDTELRGGEIVETIIEYAETNDVDAIYVGHRGMSSEWTGESGASRGRLGSVAKGVVEGTSLPVTVFDRGI